MPLMPLCPENNDTVCVCTVAFFYVPVRVCLGNSIVAVTSHLDPRVSNHTFISALLNA